MQIWSRSEKKMVNIFKGKITTRVTHSKQGNSQYEYELQFGTRNFLDVTTSRRTHYCNPHNSFRMTKTFDQL